jgi:c-di-GMP-binding flagellar brake protein YcgR
MTMPTIAERRKYRRYDLAIEVQVKPRKRAAAPMRTVTRDISARGVYFDFPEKMEPGSELEFELNLPPELAAGRTVRIRCRGKIVRVEAASQDGGVRLAATIENYEFLRPE